MEQALGAAVAAAAARARAGRRRISRRRTKDRRGIPAGRAARRCACTGGIGSSTCHAQPRAHPHDRHEESERPADTHGATPFSSPAKGQKIVGGTWSLDAPYSAMRVSIVLSCAGSDSERSFVLRRRHTETRAQVRQRQWWFALERIVDDVEELDLARRLLGRHVPALHKHLPFADAQSGVGVHVALAARWVDVVQQLCPGRGHLAARNQTLPDVVAIAVKARRTRSSQTWKGNVENVEPRLVTHSGRLRLISAPATWHSVGSQSVTWKSSWLTVPRTEAGRSGECTKPGTRTPPSYSWVFQPRNG